MADFYCVFYRKQYKTSLRWTTSRYTSKFIVVADNEVEAKKKILEAFESSETPDRRALPVSKIKKICALSVHLGDDGDYVDIVEKEEKQDDVLDYDALLEELNATS